MIIADTCLIFYLFNETIETPLAQKILEKDQDWRVPNLWREEYANVLRKLAGKQNLPKAQTLHLFGQVVEQLKNSEMFVNALDALEFSLDYKISVYDAHFVFLAMQLNTLLITNDKELMTKCPGLAIGFEDYLNK